MYSVMLSNLSYSKITKDSAVSFERKHFRTFSVNFINLNKSTAFFQKITVFHFFYPPQLALPFNQGDISKRHIQQQALKEVLKLDI